MKEATKNDQGNFVVQFSLPEWLVRKIVLEVRAAREGQEGVKTG